MLMAYKTEINPTEEQKRKINQAIGVARFIKNKQCISCERHKINIPTLGWVRLKEKGYIPIHNKNRTEVMIKSGTVSRRADRYYVSVLVEQSTSIVKGKEEQNDTGLGIDLGIKDFAVRSDGETHRNVNKTAKVKKLEKKLKREQRSLSRKYENLKKRGEKSAAEKRANIGKNILRVQKLHKKIADIIQAPNCAHAVGIRKWT